MNKINTLSIKSKSIISASAKIRNFLDTILDEKSFVELDVFVSGNSFVDGADVLGEGVVTGYASVNDEPVYLFAQNSEVLSGSFSKAQSEKIIKVINLAVKNNAPLIAITDSNGARIGEGMAVLEAYSAVTNAITIASEEIPVINIIKGNCVGLLSAVPALSDFVLMSEDALLSLSAPSVLSAKANASGKLTDILGAKTHASLSGIASHIYKDNKSLAENLRNIISIVSGGNYSSEDDPNRVCPALNNTLNIKNLTAALFDKGNFMPYASEYAKELILGFGKINGIYCGISICDSSASQVLSRQAIIKLNRFIELLDKFNIPFISLVDNSGLEAALSDEQSGIIREYAQLMKSISISGMAKIAVITGKAIGTAYTALASKSIGYDYVLAFSGAEITPVDPAVAANVIYLDEIKKAKDPSKTREELMKKYSELQGNPLVVAREGYIDNVIEPSALRPYVASALIMLLGL